MFFCYVRVFFFNFLLKFKKKNPKNHQLNYLLWLLIANTVGWNNSFHVGEVASNCFSHEVGFARDLAVCWFLCARWGILVCWLSVVGASMTLGAVALCGGVALCYLGLMDPV